MLPQAQYGLPAASYECNIREGGEGEGSMTPPKLQFCSTVHSSCMQEQWVNPFNSQPKITVPTQLDIFTISVHDCDSYNVWVK